MSGRHITISVILMISLIASHAYCRDIKAQERDVLLKAIETALEINPIPANEIGEISAYLGGALGEQSQFIDERLFERLRESAAHAESAAEYTEASVAANLVLMKVDVASPRLAQKLYESWPCPPELENQFNDFKKKFEADKQRTRLVKNPMNYLNENIPAQNMNAWIVVITGLHSRPADVRQAFARLLGASEGQHRDPTAEALSLFLEPTWWNASLFRYYVTYLKGKDSTFRGYILSCDDQSIAIDYSDEEALRVILRIIQNHPDVAAELVQAVPSLYEKAELVGGIQAISERGVIRWKTANAYVAGSIVYKGHRDFDTKVDGLCEESRRNRDEVRQLLTASKSAKDFEFLSRAASASCPAVAETASDFAREMTLNEPDAETRISMANQLLPYYDPYGTLLGPEWIQFGFEILRRAGLRTQHSMRNEFEDRLISQLAIVDFNRAMSYVESAETPLARLQIMLAVIRGLDRASSVAKGSKTQINE